MHLLIEVGVQLVEVNSLSLLVGGHGFAGNHFMDGFRGPSTMIDSIDHQTEIDVVASGEDRLDLGLELVVGLDPVPALYQIGETGEIRLLTDRGN